MLHGAMDPSRRQLAVATNRGTILFIEGDQIVETLDAVSATPPDTLTMDQDGSHVVDLSLTEQRIRLISRSKEARMDRQEGQLLSVSGDHRFGLSYREGTYILFDTDRGEKLRTLSNPLLPTMQDTITQNLQLSWDGSILLGLKKEVNGQNALFLVDTVTNRTLGEVKVNDGARLFTAFVPGEKMLLLTDGEGSVDVINAQNGTKSDSFSVEPGFNGDLIQWKNFEEKSRVTLEYGDVPRATLGNIRTALSPDGRYLVTRFKKDNMYSFVMNETDFGCAIDRQRAGTSFTAD